MGKENKTHNINILSGSELLIVLFLCLCSSLSAQYDTVRHYYSSGKIESIIPTYNKIPEGNARYYFEDGNLKEEKEYVSGRIEGVVKLYHATGKLKELYTIENGKREGPASYYDSTGNFTSEVFYSNGLKQPAQPSDTTGITDSVEVNLAKINVKQDILPPKVSGVSDVAYKAHATAEQIKSTVKVQEKEVIEKPKIDAIQENVAVTEQAKSKAEVHITITNTTAALIDTIKKVEVLKDNQLMFNTKDTLIIDLTDISNPLIKLFDQVPAPASGEKFFNEKLNYPAYAKKKNISGTVVIKALVHENGDIMSVETYKSVDMNLDEAALIAVNYTKFTPAIYHSMAVKVYILYPVEFKLKK